MISRLRVSTAASSRLLIGRSAVPCSAAPPSAWFLTTHASPSTPSAPFSSFFSTSTSAANSATIKSCALFDERRVLMTKIICTLGPAVTDDPSRVQQLVHHGLSVARLNFSHAGDDYSYPEQCQDYVQQAAGRHAERNAEATAAGVSMPRNLRGCLVDTKGPEIRTGPLQGGRDVVQIAAGATVELTFDSVADQEAPETSAGPHRLQVDYPSLATTIKVGCHVLLDDGLLALEVTGIDDSAADHNSIVTCIALNSGPMKQNKGVNLPNTVLDLPALTAKDKRDMEWACRRGADYVAASFIRTAANVRSVKAHLNQCIADLIQQQEEATGTDTTTTTTTTTTPLRPLIISKIESKEGVDNFDEILAESDGIMVARGDLGVEIPYYEVFAAQKYMVQACNEAGKPCIVATQMLDSMQRNPRPTRAEVTDVGTAVLDGADAVMLSGETAAGQYPIESIQAMRKVIAQADEIVDKQKGTAVAAATPRNTYKLSTTAVPMDQELDAIAKSSVQSARDLDAKMIVVITMSGKVARAVAAQRPTVPVLAFCTDPQVARRLQLHRAVTPVLLQSALDPTCAKTRMGLLRAEAIRTAKELGYLRAGDRILTVDRTVGKPHDMHEYSHNLKLTTIRDS